MEAHPRFGDCRDGILVLLAVPAWEPGAVRHDHLVTVARQEVGLSNLDGHHQQQLLLHNHLHVGMYVCTYVCMYVCRFLVDWHVCMYACIYTRMCVDTGNVCKYVRLVRCMHVPMHACIYLHISIWSRIFAEAN